MDWTGTFDNGEKISIQGVEPTNTQRYFKDVGRVYRRNNDNYEIEYTPENRERLIEMNLKCVIKVAKRYLGNGLTLDELVCAGNEGLCKAWKKFNPDSVEISISFRAFFASE